MIVDGNNFISHYLKNNLPLCAGKIGVTELNVLHYTEHYQEDYTDILRHEVEDIAGLYPFNLSTASRFRVDLTEALKVTDLIPKWNRVLPQYEERIFKQFCPKAHITQLQHLEPYFFDKPWTNQLKGKKVLVVSPFAHSIKRNYYNLDKIWNGKITNNFELETLKYPFALKIQPNEHFKTSEEVYSYYLDTIRSKDFDIGIFGTGYTSLLFAAECKRMGKVGIHLGGATQILFGIKGQRWREIKEFQPFFNEHWTDPMESEKPKDRQKVEGGCYW